MRHELCAHGIGSGLDRRRKGRGGSDDCTRPHDSMANSNAYIDASFDPHPPRRLRRPRGPPSRRPRQRRPLRADGRLHGGADGRSPLADPAEKARRPSLRPRRADNERFPAPRPLARRSGNIGGELELGGALRGAAAGDLNPSRLRGLHAFAWKRKIRFTRRTRRCEETAFLHVPFMFYFADDSNMPARRRRRGATRHGFRSCLPPLPPRRLHAGTAGRPHPGARRNRLPARGLPPVGLSLESAYRLYRRSGAESFRRAWDAALAAARPPRGAAARSRAAAAQGSWHASTSSTFSTSARAERQRITIVSRIGFIKVRTTIGGGR